MGIFEKILTTSDAINTDVLSDSEVAESANYRRVARIGLAGSSAIGDTKLSLFYGHVWIATFYNSNITALTDEDMRVISQRKWCPPSLGLRVVVDDAPNANAILVLDVQEILPNQGFGFNRGFRGNYS